MKLLRSWPTEEAFEQYINDDVLAGRRGYVVDGIERLVMSDFDYRCLVDVGDDIVLIEWDIAVGQTELATFMERAAADPDQVRVAPYLLYREFSSHRKPFYVHRAKGAGARRYVTGPEQPTCDMFGFGLVYLPYKLVCRFAAQLPANRKFTDTTFSYWHRTQAPVENRTVPIDWDVPCVHLHYVLPEVPA